MEIQGDHVEAVRAFLAHPAHLLGLNRKLLPAAPAPAAPAEAPASRPAEKEVPWWKEKKEDDPLLRRKPRHKRKEADVGALARPGVHNSKPRCPQNWPYCSGW